MVSVFRRLRIVEAAIILGASSMMTGCATSDDATDEPAAGAVEEQAPDGAAPHETPERFEYSSYTELEPLMQELGYTPETWQAGIREIPRLYLTTIPSRWRDQVSKEVTVQVKKRIFFRLGAPLVLRASEMILEEREWAESLIATIRGGEEIAGGDRAWLTGLAVRYGAIEDEGRPLDEPSLDELLVRVDIVPLSLALSQAAEESGWGTSRFAAEGNALFGQWTWSGKGVKPEQQREGMGDYRVASFDSPLESVAAYMYNLNTHHAYRELRARRATMRRKGERMSGWVLAETLNRYSERGEDYVKTLHTIMRVNQLDPADDAYLGSGRSIHLVPVGEGTK